MEFSIEKTWKQYEAGKEHKRRIGLYETVRKNERFYRGDQWSGSAADLPRPVFNLTRRITDYLVCAVAPERLTVTYTDDRLPFTDNASVRSAIQNGLELLSKSASYRWKQNQMSALSYQALMDAAISGDGVFYCWWDANQKSGQPFLGDIRTDLVDNVNLFVADVNRADLQSQDYIILSGRASVEALRNEARDAGVSEENLQKITADSDLDGAFDNSFASEQSGFEKATYLICFYRDGGEVVFEKSTKSCLIKKVHTGLKHYPVAYFNWHRTKNSFHGASPVSDLIANQKYINTAYAMAMKHMSDTAFSKIIYDKSRIPEWSNEVGEAIAAMGGGNVADAVSVVGVGSMQEGYLDLISNVIETTKDMMGATDSALGNEEAHNTSAILALQKVSQISLLQVKANFCKCIGELATIWADMLCTYCPQERLLAVIGENGVCADRIDYALLRRELLRATAELEDAGQFTSSATVTLLDKLLEKQYLSVEQYLELLPAGSITNREALIQKIKQKGELQNE